MTTKLFRSKFAAQSAPVPGVGGCVFIGALVAALLNACAVSEAPKQQIPVAIIPVTPVPQPTIVNEEADAALKVAELSVNEARIKRALWTAAVEELARARAAAKAFDSAATLRHARETIALCNLSIAQLSKPPVDW